MNRNEYLGALRKALSGLPDEELGGALRYYEEYFDDAGDDNIEGAIANLGSPESVATQIMADYRELAVSPTSKSGYTHSSSNSNHESYQEQTQQSSFHRHPILSLLGGLCLVVILLPIIAALGSSILGIILSIVGIAIALLVVLFALPLALVIAGAALLGFSFMTLPHVASALATGGLGIILIAVGAMLAVVFYKLCKTFIPAIFQSIVRVIRTIVNKIAGLFHRRNGGTR